MHARYRLRYIEFTDDIFTVDKEWVRRFTAAYRREIGVPFQCLVHPRFIDRDVARWLKEAGCQHVQMGVQSVDEEYKRKTLLRMEKDDHLRRSLEALRAEGLDAKLDHILGLPGEPRTAQEEARKLYVEFAPRRVQTFWLTYVPGIELTRQALADGVLTREEVDEHRPGQDPRLPPPSPGIPRATTTPTSTSATTCSSAPCPSCPGGARAAPGGALPRMGEKAASAVGFAFDLANALRRLDKETLIFAKHYAHHLARTLFELLPASLRPAHFRPENRASNPGSPAPGPERCRRRPLQVVAQEA